MSFIPFHLFDPLQTIIVHQGFFSSFLYAQKRIEQKENAQLEIDTPNTSCKWDILFKAFVPFVVG